ncbi:unnamed protein product, partial [Sphacelaria rigidula]
ADWVNTPTPRQLSSSKLTQLLFVSSRTHAFDGGNQILQRKKTTHREPNTRSLHPNGYSRAITPLGRGNCGRACLSEKTVQFAVRTHPVVIGVGKGVEAGVSVGGKEGLAAVALGREE